MSFLLELILDVFVHGAAFITGKWVTNNLIPGFEVEPLGRPRADVGSSTYGKARRRYLTVEAAELVGFAAWILLGLTIFGVRAI